MVDIVRCDSCNKEIPEDRENELTFATYKETGMEHWNNYDLCDSCFRSIILLLRGHLGKKMPKYYPRLKKAKR